MLEILKKQVYRKYVSPYPDLQWEFVESRLKDVNTVALKALRNMESGGEPDTIGFDEAGDRLIFCDCFKESPAARRSLSYDDEGFAKAKEESADRQRGSAGEENGHRAFDRRALPDRLQQLGEFDLKTSSWIHGLSRGKKGGALFCERRYGRSVYLSTD